MDFPPNQRMGNRLRIVLVGPMYPFRGGIAHLSETMASGLASRGHEVHAITFSRQYPALLFPGRTQYESGPVQKSTLKAEQLVDSVHPCTWWKTARRIQALKADRVIFRYWMPFFAPAFGMIARLVACNRSNLWHWWTMLSHMNVVSEIWHWGGFSLNQCTGAWSCLQRWIKIWIH